jgi:hypothetical protein
VARVEDEELRTCITMLANALHRHRDDWWEDASESVNRRHREEVNAALDEARRLGWTPT